MDERIRMDMENQGKDVLILPDMRSGFGREMLVISASVDPEDPAESLNAVLETEFMYSVWFLSECGVNMAIAFLDEVFLFQLGIAFLKFLCAGDKARHSVTFVFVV